MSLRRLGLGLLGRWGLRPALDGPVAGESADCVEALDIEALDASCASIKEALEEASTVIPFIN